MNFLTTLFIVLIYSLYWVPNAYSTSDRVPGVQKEYEGKISLKGWAKSSDSYFAGGSDYFVLCPDRNDDNSDKSCILLRETEDISFVELEKHQGKKVKISGVWEEKKKESAKAGEIRKGGQMMIDPSSFSSPDAERKYFVPGSAQRFKVESIKYSAE